MQVQIVRASTRHKVLSEARRLLGPDPLVLAVRRQPTDDGVDLEWEAVVARETPMAVSSRKGTSSTTPRAVAELRRELAAARMSGEVSETRILDLGRRLAQLETEVLCGLLDGRALNSNWLPLIERLDASGFPKGDALGLIQKIESTGVSEVADTRFAVRCIREALKARVKIAPTEERVDPGVVIFCGGSGVGKTTLAAKLAADLCLGGMKRPVLGVLLPRPGLGVETLRRCARTLGIDFVEVRTPSSLDELAKTSKSNPVILDSAAVNPRDAHRMRQLEETLVAAPQSEVHTVVPATYGVQDFDTALAAFGSIGAKRLSVTRLDEAPYVGRVLAAASRGQVAIGYFSQGPRIPDDLVRPSIDALLNAVLGTEVIAPL